MINDQSKPKAAAPTEQVDQVSRRSFVFTSAASFAMVATGLSASSSALTAQGAPRRLRNDIGAVSAEQGTTVLLFQGDSITDVSRNKTNQTANSTPALGGGYPLLIGGELLLKYPARHLEVLNRGISGNRVPDLAARWADDTIALKPNILTILIGVNDLWHKMMGRSNGTVQEYEDGYNALLDQTRAALPDVKLVVLEPFVLRTGVVLDTWFPEFDQRREAAVRVAKRAKATFIPLHTMFAKLSEKASPAYWAADGVHPTAAGHAAIAHAWLDAVKV